MGLLGHSIEPKQNELMGIRFRCIHCDRKLNVKAKQAGEVCVCPDCENEIQIPFESEIKKKRKRRPSLDTLHAPLRQTGSQLTQGVSSEIRIDVTDTVDVIADGGSIDKPVSSKLDVPVLPIAGIQAADPQNVIEEVDQADQSDSFILSKPVIKVEEDPLRSDPNRVWYVRHSRLGEKGPLKAAAVEALIDEGYLQVGHIVWREDWNDWLRAEEVFSEIAARHHRALTDPDWMIPDEVNPHSQARKDDRKKRLVWLTLISVGFLAVIVLVYLVYIFAN